MNSALRFVGAALCLVGTLLAARAATIPGLFNTGVDNNRALLANGSVDPHYRLIQSPDGAAPGPNAFVVNDGAFPIPPWIANGPSSKWIAPMAAQGTGNLPGNYIYRTTFDLTGLEPASAVITGQWSSDNEGVDIRVNGASTGIGNSAQFGGWTTFTITAGAVTFLPGTNTIDFVVNNAGTGANPTGFRAEISGTADLEAPPGTPPSIVAHPNSQTVGRGDPAIFRVTAYGSKPLTYQWRLNGTPVSGATGTVHTIDATTANNTGNYDVVVANSFGSVTSNPAMLHAVVLSPAQLTYEPLGPSTRRTGLVISEVMYHPAERADGLNLEFIEIHNSNVFPEDLSGYRLSGAVDFVFPSNTTIPGLGFIVVAAAPADIAAVYGINGVFGPFTNNLPNSTGTIRLRKKSDAIVWETTYSDEPPWPVAADGAGPSLVLARGSFGERDPQAWAASANVGGSPGSADAIPSGPLESIVINELAANPAAPAPDFIELFNAGPNTVDLSGCWLSDRNPTNRFQIPTNTTIAPFGFLSFDSAQTGFGLSAAGDTVLLWNPAQTRVVAALKTPPQSRDTSWSRVPDGAPFLFVGEPTRGTTNRIAAQPVVINEVMYNPVGEGNAGEFIELHNRTTNAVSVAGWRLSGGVSFTFPANASIPANGFIVAGANAAHLLASYSNLTAAKTFGDWSGNLANSGERIVLERPEVVPSESNPHRVLYMAVDEVTYGTGGRWPKAADGQGSSLELIDARSPWRLAPHWAASDESQKAGWTTVEATGPLSHAHPSVSVADQLQLFLQGAGEALVDDVEVIPGTSGNRISNGTFEGGTTGWFFQGTHRQSYLETSQGHNSARSLHLVATDRGDHVANRVRAPLSTGIPASGNVTIRAKVRWLRGHPEILFRLRGNHFEAVGQLNVPANLGTPGAPNSRAAANVAPAITEVSHRPVLPQAGQNIRVTARVLDADGIASVTLRYRLDPAAQLFNVPMLDDGNGADAAPGDGIFTGVIPAQSAGTLVAFHIVASDAAGLPASAQFPVDAPIRECLVRVGESLPPGNAFGTYRFWITAATHSFWSSREKMSNEGLDATFVYGTNRVIYNAEALYAGSAYTSPGYTTPTGSLCGYDLLLPEDEIFLGTDHVTLDWPVRDDTNQREQLMFWFLEQYGLPNNYRRYVNLYVNGVKRGTIYDDVQQPDRDLIEEWFPNDIDGTLWKTDCWFETTDNGTRVDPCILNTLEVFTAGGVKKTARYRWNWRPRAVSGSANDFTDLFALVDAANAQGAAYIPALGDTVDMEHWMRTFAMNDLASFWDAFGNPNAKNTYLYKPEDDGWKLFSWDFDVGLGVFNDPPDAPLFPSNVDAAVQRMYGTPQFVRAYWRALDEALNGFFRTGAGTDIDRILDSKYAAFQMNSVGLNSPAGIKSWINSRRAYLLAQLGTVASPFTLATPETFSTNSNVATISGTAPVRAATIVFNGVAHPVTWTTVSNWTARVVLAPGANTLNVQARDLAGNVLTTAVVNAESTLAPQSPVDLVVINEIMYDPVFTNAAYLELFNASATHSFDLGGWRLNGLDYTFPPGTVLTNGQFLLLAKDRAAFAAAYGNAIPVFGEFAGNLDRGGETISLVMPGPPDTVVDRVTYDDDEPWPQAARGGGGSLQVIDPLQDNRRVANWSDGVGWKFFSFSGNNTTTRLSIFLGSAGNVFIDDLKLVPGTEPEVGDNVVRNGDFEGPFTVAQGGPWNVPANMTNSTISSAVKRSGNGALHVVATSAGNGSTANSIWQDTLPITTNAVYTLSFWYLPTTSATNLTIRTGSFLRPVVNVQPQLASPGARNTVARTLPPFPLVWLNEVQPNNVNGLADNAGDRDPWVELLNDGASPLTLDGLYLSDNFSNVLAWPFPAGASLAADSLRLVWADGEPGETTAADWHTSFRIPPATGAVVLARMTAEGPQILDYISYANVGADVAFGSYPDGEPIGRRALTPTPGQTNDARAVLVPVRINEWMADNGSIPDPADGQFDDWFELYNPSGEPVNLSGYRVNDALSFSGAAVIPAGFVIPANGYLLVWADEQSGQSHTNGDLHVNFKLSRGGEVIALYAPDGRLVDSVSFGAQSNSVSQGRFPDGNVPPFSFMTTPTPRAANTLGGTPPSIRVTAVVLAGNGPTLTWTSRAGGVYRVEFRAELDQGSWQPLSGEITASGEAATFTDETAVGVTRRFYRVVYVR